MTREPLFNISSGKVEKPVTVESFTLQCQINGGLNNRESWKFPGYLISVGVLINGVDGKLKNYVFIVNVKKRILANKNKI